MGAVSARRWGQRSFHLVPHIYDALTVSRPKAKPRSHLDPVAKMVLVAIAGSVNQTGISPGSLESVAKGANCSLRTARRKVKSLRIDGWVQRDSGGYRLTERVTAQAKAEPSRFNAAPGSRQASLAQELIERFRGQRHESGVRDLIERAQVHGAATPAFFRAIAAGFRQLGIALPGEGERRSFFLTRHALTLELGCGKRGDAGPIAKSVLVFLSTRIGFDGACAVPIETIMKCVECEDYAVRSAIKKLVALGCLEEIEIPGYTNRYRLSPRLMTAAAGKQRSWRRRGMSWRQEWQQAFPAHGATIVQALAAAKALHPDDEAAERRAAEEQLRSLGFVRPSAPPQF